MSGFVSYLYLVLSSYTYSADWFYYFYFYYILCFLCNLFFPSIFYPWRFHHKYFSLFSHLFLFIHYIQKKNNLILVVRFCCFLLDWKHIHIFFFLLLVYLYHFFVGWGCRIHWLHLCRGVRLPNECSGYDTKQSDGEASVMLELWGMQSTPSLPSLPGSFWLGVVALDRVLSMSWIELCTILNWIVWNRTVPPPFFFLTRLEL